MGAPTAWEVLVYRAGALVATEVLTQAETIIGRFPKSAKLVLASESVSRRHAILRQRGAQLTVEDAGSTNGIRVNGKPVARCALADNDVIKIAEFSLTIRARTRPEITAQRDDVAPTRLFPRADHGPAMHTAGPEPLRRSDSSSASRGNTRPGAGGPDETPWFAVTVSKHRVVADVHMLSPGQALWLGPPAGGLPESFAGDLPPRFALAQVDRTGRCTIQLPMSVGGAVTEKGQSTALTEIEYQRVEGERTLLRRFDLDSEQVLKASDHDTQYVVTAVVPPVVARPLWPMLKQWIPGRRMQGLIGGSTVLHVLGLVAIGVLSPAMSLPRSTASARNDFVEVQLENQAALSEPDKTPPQVEKAVSTVRQKRRPRSMESATAKRTPRAGGTSNVAPGVLGLLQKSGSTSPGPVAAVAAATNIEAARAPSSHSGFRVSGLLGKLPTSQLSLGGGGGVVTRGGAAVLRGGEGGGGHLAGQGEREVYGLVQKVPRAMLSTGTGKLDKELIQKVLNANVGEIQRCYERALIKTPSLTGQVQVEWIISLSGAVRQARQKSSTLGSSEAVSCILGSIGRWRFPRPSGGEVVVTYPFTFRPVAL